MKKDNLFRPVLMLTMICFITTLLLAATNELTAPSIAMQEQTALNERMKTIFPDGQSFEQFTVTDQQSEALLKSNADVDNLYIAKDSAEKIIGYVFVTSSNGYAGKVTASVGIDTSGKVAMIAFTAPDETPGLGKKIEENGFSDPFSGISTATPVVIGGSEEGVSIDAVSGATISSKGAAAAVNKSFAAYLYLSDEGSLS